MSTLDTRGIDLEELRQEAFPPVQHSFRVYISEEAFDRLTERGDADASREVGGVLVGGVFRDDAGPYIRVDTTVDGLHAEEKSAEFTFTHATWDHIHREMDTRHQGERVVGWYHTHPGFGVFLSDRDEFIHRSFFDLPYQIAVVYDPKSREHGIFAWRDDEPRRFRRHWVGRSEHLWDGPQAQTAQSAAAEEPAPETGPVQRPVLPALDRPTLAGVALALVLLGGLVGWWIAGRSASEAIEQARAQVLEARLLGYREAVESLNADLLLLLRQTLDATGVQRSLDRALAELEEGLGLLPTYGEADESAAAALLKLERGRERLAHLRVAYTRTRDILTTLEPMSRRASFDASSVHEELAVQRATLGTICAELAQDAARADDPARARRLLALAQRVDPAGRQRYENLTRDLGLTQTGEATEER